MMVKNSIKIGIIGAGQIAVNMANTINNIDGFINYAIASRDINKAKYYQNKFNFVKAYGSYLELIQDENVELVYIATVHSTHYEIMMLCLQYSKPVLCEKSFTTTLKDTIEIYSKFENKKIFISEALWTSFLPYRDLLSSLLYEERIVGNISSIIANFEIEISDIERIRRRELGGGSMLDLGVYPLSFIFRTLGYNYIKCDIKDVQYNELGVDIMEVVEFVYNNETKAICNISANKNGFSNVIINGEEGKIIIDSVNCPRKITVIKNNKVFKEYFCGPKITGFEFELNSCKRALENDELECKEWTHENSISVCKIVDRVVNKM